MASQHATSTHAAAALPLECYQDQLVDLLIELWYELPAIGSRLFSETETTESEGRAET